MVVGSSQSREAEALVFSVLPLLAGLTRATLVMSVVSFCYVF